jgi:urease accessory protein
MPARIKAMTTDALYRLLAWSSPAFPTGAFSYSHGLESAALDGAVCDRATLEAWIAAIVTRGSGRVDADVLRDAWLAVGAGDEAGLADANRRGCAYRATAELALEASQQGVAFCAAHEAAWVAPDPVSNPLVGEGGGVCHAAAFGAAAAHAGIGLHDALLAYLHAFAANLMSAGLRLGVVGQNDGQRILAELESVIVESVATAVGRDGEDFGSATFASDLASMAHETQYSRLFRS